MEMDGIEKVEFSPHGLHSLGRPQPEGCPAIHVLLAERKSFAEGVRIPVKAIARIHKIVRGIVSEDTCEMDGARRIDSICLWALTGEASYVTDLDDLAALSEFLSPRVAPPEGPASPGTPS